MSWSSSAPSQVVAATIDVGTHPHIKILGLTINTDTVLTTLIAWAESPSGPVDMGVAPGRPSSCRTSAP
jgi:hypothetical protein